MYSIFIKKNINKVILIFLGFIVLYTVSKSFFSLFLIFLVSLFTFLISHFKNHIIPSSRQEFEKICVPLSFAILVLFNIFGFIKTLTGTIENNTSTHLLFVGITFYILSAGAYIADNKITYTKQNLLNEYIDLFLYLILPFKLLAGPLESPQIINQFNNITLNIIKSHSRYLYSFTWISLGIFMKFCIASRLTPSNLLIYTDPVGSFVCAFIFELKFYFDFAGYSFIVFGLAKLFGLNLTLNFNHPFTANNVVEFWHKWHISLGKFLQRYILIKNLSTFKSRMTKAIFASSIFLISAMWHGGTLNYFYWGLFHGLVYLFYIQNFKFKKIPKFIGILSMFIFFVFGRMIAIDINSGRLVDKFMNYFIISNYNFDINYLIEIFSLGLSQKFILVTIFIFLFFEFYQTKFYKKNSYHFFRKPFVSISLFAISILYGFNSLELLYARI